MKKAVYSLVLSEDVVRAVDALAYREGSNRSALIDRILAEYMSFVTPEMRVKEVLDKLSALLSASGVLIGEPSASVLPFRSSLAYKYNPTVRYGVELYRDGDALGALKASLRTQNSALLALMRGFYSAFSEVEEDMIGNVQYYVEDDKYMRVLRFKSHNASSYTSSDVADFISRYVDTFDRALKAYFAADNEKAARTSVRRIYRAYLEKCEEII